MFKKQLLAALLLTACAGAFAQSPAAPVAPSRTPATAALTPAQKAQFAKQDTQMAQATLQIAQMVDQGQIGAVWDQASTVAKQTTKRTDFVRQLNTDRAQLGAPSARKLAAITRTQSKGGRLRAGLYINVSYATEFAKARQPVRELVSYHPDSDRTWRVAGYTVH